MSTTPTAAEILALLATRGTEPGSMLVDVLEVRATTPNGLVLRFPDHLEASTAGAWIASEQWNVAVDSSAATVTITGRDACSTTAAAILSDLRLHVDGWRSALCACGWSSAAHPDLHSVRAAVRAHLLSRPA